MDPTEARWLEVQFFYLCKEVVEIRNNLMDIMDLIDALAIFGTYSPEQLKQIAQEVLTFPNIAPMKDEFCLLCHKNKVSIETIRKKMKTSNNKIYWLLKAESKEPRIFYPRLHTSKVQAIEKFLETYNRLRNLGVFENA